MRLGIFSIILASSTLCQSAQAIDLTAGPMVGHVTDKSARVWLQFPVAGEVTVTAFDVERQQPVSSLRTGLQGPTPYVCDMPLNNLEANKSYRVEIKFDGVVVKIPGPDLVVRTAPSPGDEAPFMLAFGSKMNPSGRGTAPIFKAITNLKPRLFLFLGNEGYLPAKLEEFPDTRRNAYRFIAEMHSKIRREPDLQELFRTTPCYAVFGDRDFGTTDSGKTFVFAQESLLAFQRFWPNPEWGTPENPGCYCSFSMGDVDIFLVDTRSFRDPGVGAGGRLGGADGGTAGATGGATGVGTGGGGRPMASMLGGAQLDWLRKGLKASRATFKVVASGASLFGPGGAGGTGTSWAEYPEEQGEFVRWLVAEQIGGVISLAGGQPAGSLTRYVPGAGEGRAGGALQYPLFTLGCSTLTVVPGEPGKRAEPVGGGAGVGQVGEAVVEDNFGTLDFSGQRDHRFVTLRLRDERGKVRAEQTVFASQLK